MLGHGEGLTKIHSDGTTKLMETRYRYLEHKCTLQTLFSYLSHKMLARIIGFGLSVKGKLDAIYKKYAAIIHTETK